MGRWMKALEMTTARLSPAMALRPLLEDHLRRRRARAATGVAASAPRATDTWRAVRAHAVPEAQPIVGSVR